VTGGWVLSSDYLDKFDNKLERTLFEKLDKANQVATRNIAIENRFTFQELKIFIESAIDLNIWNEESLISHWDKWRLSTKLKGREFKKWAFGKLDVLLAELREKENDYSDGLAKNPSYRHQKVTTLPQASDTNIFGSCPVYSEATLCCNLQTIDAVKNCGFGCSYCSIQTMYTDDNILFDEHFGQKLNAIELDPNKHYHIGTGQSSDALMWGNTNGILDDLFCFARKWPNVLLEFKTKSKNVDYLLQADVPDNIVCSWSLNPDVIINNEEHLTPSLNKRLAAARSVADKGIRVGFHLHPMVIHKGWQKNYQELINDVIDQFHSDEVVFVSFGSLTFPKPIIKKIRSYGIQSKIHQIPMASNPEGKMTYPDEIKEQLFRHAYESFKTWHSKVFFYLCMEEKKLWDLTFGESYKNNKIFEDTLIESALKKMLIPAH
jgi:DNA repair photolyase